MVIFFSRLILIPLTASMLLKKHLLILLLFKVNLIDD